MGNGMVTVKKALVQVNVLTINDKHVTQAFVRQIPYKTLVLFEEVIGLLDGFYLEGGEWRSKAIGYINYFPDLEIKIGNNSDPDDFFHFIFYEYEILYRSYIPRRPLERIQHLYDDFQQIYISI